tara:strand:- start:18712 stop:19200 length:489 start_codon:yes stop_codon:yes gene_type:complete
LNQCVIQSPVGQLKLSAAGGYLLRIDFINEQEVCSLPTDSLLKESVKQLQAYFNGKLEFFDLPLKPIGTDFQLRVWEALGKIPYGTSWSYLQQATFLGDAKCIRAAASANGKNPLPIVIPCHRVIGTDQKLVGFGGGLWRKELLLGHEKHPNYQYKQGMIKF